MSARKYKTLLEGAERTILALQTSAEQWKEVADERLDIIRAHGKILGALINRIAGLDEVLGLEIKSGGCATVFDDSASPSACISGLGANVEITVSFMLDMMAEVASLEAALRSTEEKITGLSGVKPPHDPGSAMATLQQSADLSTRILTMTKKQGGTPGSSVHVDGRSLINSSSRIRPRQLAIPAKGNDILS